MKKIIFCIALIFCFPAYPFAQESSSLSTQSQSGTMNLSLIHLRPLEKLSLNGYQNGWGLSMEWLTNDLGKNAPINFQAGVRFSFTDHGKYKTEVDLNEPIEGRAKYRLENSQAGILGVARFITKDGPVRFFADFQGGLQSFSTSESYNLIRTFSSYEEYSSDKTSTTWGLNYGGAAGMQVNLGNGNYLDIRGLYLRGTDARFADLKGVAQIENMVYYPSMESKTSQWGLQAGVTFKLWDGDSDDCDCNCNH